MTRLLQMPAGRDEITEPEPGDAQHLVGPEEARRVVRGLRQAEFERFIDAVCYAV
jgi:hypothetical protein